MNEVTSVGHREKNHHVQLPARTQLTSHLEPGSNLQAAKLEMTNRVDLELNLARRQHYLQQKPVLTSRFF